MNTLWLCRHGNRIDFVDPTWADRHGYDPHLSPDGVVQAQETGRRLACERVDFIFASPFLRAVETAHHIAEAIRRPIFIEPGACEWLRADWFPGTPRWLEPRALARRFPRVDAAYEPLVRPEYPEDEAQLAGRTARTIARLSERYAGSLLLIGHGASVKHLGRALLGREQPIHCPLCALIKIARDADRWRLELNGDTSHLSEGEKHRQKLTPEPPGGNAEV